MSQREALVHTETHNQHQAICSIKLHPMFGLNRYIFKRNGLKLSPLCLPEDKKKSREYPIHNALEEVMSDAFYAQYPRTVAFPHISSSFRRSDQSSDGCPLDIFDITLNPELSDIVLRHPRLRQNLIILTREQLIELVDNNRWYRIDSPNYGYGNLQLDSNCLTCIQDFEKTKQRRQPQGIRARMEQMVFDKVGFLGETDYRLRSRLLQRLEEFVDPKMVQELKKVLFSSRLTEKLLLVSQGIIEGLAAVQLLKSSDERLQLIQLLSAGGIALAEFATERHAMVSKVMVYDALKPIVKELAVIYQVDARLQGYTPQELSDMLLESASAFADAEAVPPTYLETGPATVSIITALVSSNQKELALMLLGGYLIVQKLLGNQIHKSNPFEGVFHRSQTYAHLIAAAGRSLTPFLASFGLSGPQIAVSTLIAEHTLEVGADIAPVQNGRAAYFLIHRLLDDFSLTVTQDGPWKDHCVQIQHQTDAGTVDVLKTEMLPGSAAFIGYTFGIENKVLLDKADLILYPGLNTLELKPGMGLTRILSVLGERITHSSGSGYVYSYGQVYDIHNHPHKLSHYADCGKISLDDYSESPLYADADAMKSFLISTFLFSEEEIDRFTRKGFQTSDDRFFRKRIAVALAGSCALYKSARVLFLDNFDKDVENPENWKAIVSFLNRLSKTLGVVIVVGCQEGFLDSNWGSHDGTYKEMILDQHVPLNRNTVSNKTFASID